MILNCAVYNSLKVLVSGTVAQTLCRSYPTGGTADGFVIVPAPAAAALIEFAGAICGRRRRNELQSKVGKSLT